MKNTLFLIISLITFSLFSQDSDFKWVKTVRGNSYEKGLHVLADHLGNTYSVGTFKWKFDEIGNTYTYNFLCNSYSANQEDIYIQKLNADGDRLWIKQVGGASKEYPTSIDVDVDGNLFVAGYFSGSVDFDPGVGENILTSNGGRDAFLLKLNADGSFNYVKQIGGTADDKIETVKIDFSGNIIVSGQFSGTVDFDPSTGVQTITDSGIGYKDVFFVKFDSNCNFSWVKIIQGDFLTTHGEVSNTMSLNNSGDIFLTGNVGQTNDFDPGIGFYQLTTDIFGGCFILKLTADGVFSWVKKINQSSATYSTLYTKCIDVDNFGNILLSGQFIGTKSFGIPTSLINLTALGYTDNFILKYDSNGNFMWVNHIGSDQYEYVNSIDTDSFGNIFTTGYFNGTNTDFDPKSGVNILASNGGYDIFIQKLDPNGSLIWVKQIAGADHEFANSIDLDNFGNIYTAGDFSQSFMVDDPVDFDPGIGFYTVLNSYQDVYVHKLEHCEIHGTDVRTSCGPYTWIDGNTYTSNNSTAVHRIENGGLNGCDSIVTLNLTMSTHSTGIDTQVACNSYTWIDGNTYTSNNTSATFTIVGGSSNGHGCDSIVTLNLTINNNATGIDTQVACNSYTWIDGNTYTSSNTSATHAIVGGGTNGCDSIVTLNLTINYSTTGIDTQTAIDSYTWIDGITYTSNNNSAVYTLVEGNASNCDSIITLNLTFTNSLFELNSNSANEVFPNPSTGKFYLKHTYDRLIIYNNLGSKVYSQENTQMDNQEIDLSSQLNGIYYLEIISGKNISMAKVVILK